MARIIQVAKHILLPRESTATGSGNLLCIKTECQTHCAPLRSIVAGRTYVVTGKASLTAPAWLALTSFTTADNGTQRTVTDTAAGGGTKFYRVEITLP